MRLLLLFCLALPFWAVAGELERCAELAEQRESVKLSKDCPKLWQELQAQGLAATSEPPLEDEVTAAQLRFLLPARHTSQKAAPIRRDGLQQLLAEILQPAAADPQAEWWKALLAWLDKLKSGDYEKQYRWLTALLSAIAPSAELVQALLYGSIALLVAVSAWLVSRELHYAGVFAKLLGVRRKAASGKPSLLLKGNASLALHDLEAQSPRRQIATLLDSVIATLAKQDAIPADATLTYRQLERHIGITAPQAEAAFAALLRHAEPVLYGNRNANQETVNTCRQQAQLLLECATS